MISTGTTTFASSSNDRGKAQHSDEVVDAKRCTVQLQNGFLYLDAIASSQTSLFGYDPPAPVRSTPNEVKRLLSEIDSRYECVALSGDYDIASRIVNTIGSKTCQILDARDLEPRSDDGRISIVLEDETIGRAGVLIASTLWRRQPDIVVLGSALAWGEPFAAVLVSRLLRPSIPDRLTVTEEHALPQTTVDRVAGALRVIEDEDVLDHARRVAAYFEERLRSLKETCPQIESLDVAGLSASIGLAPTLNAANVKRELCQRGVLVGVHNLLRLKVAPPLCIRLAEVDVITGTLRGVLLGFPTWRGAPCCNSCEAADTRPQAED